MLGFDNWREKWEGKIIKDESFMSGFSYVDCSAFRKRENREELRKTGCKNVPL